MNNQEKLKLFTQLGRELNQSTVHDDWLISFHVVQAQVSLFKDEWNLNQSVVFGIDEQFIQANNVTDEQTQEAKQFFSAWLAREDEVKS